MTRDGIYQEGDAPLLLTVKNAEVAADFFDWVCYEGDEIFYDKVTSKLLPLAQRSTAGLFLKYAQEMLKTTEIRINRSNLNFRIIN